MSSLMPGYTDAVGKAWYEFLNPAPDNLPWDELPEGEPGREVQPGTQRYWKRGAIHSVVAWEKVSDARRKEFGPPPPPGYINFLLYANLDDPPPLCHDPEMKKGEVEARSTGGHVACNFYGVRTQHEW